MKRTKDILICCALLALTAFLVCGAMLLVSTKSTLTGIDINARLNRAEVSLGETTRQLRALIKDSKDSLDDNYYDVKAQVETTTVILRSLSETVEEVNKKLLPLATVAVNHLGSAASNGANAAQGLKGAVDDLGRLATALRVDAEAAKPAIDGATVLLATLNTGSGQALDKASVALGDVDERVKALEPIERSFESTSKHVDGASAYTEETLGYIRDNFKPSKKSFWVRLLDSATAGMFSVVLHWVPQRVHEVN